MQKAFLFLVFLLTSFLAHSQSWQGVYTGRCKTLALKNGNVAHSDYKIYIDQTGSKLKIWGQFSMEMGGTFEIASSSDTIINGEAKDLYNNRRYKINIKRSGNSISGTWESYVPDQQYGEYTKFGIVTIEKSVSALSVYAASDKASGELWIGEYIIPAQELSASWPVSKQAHNARIKITKADSRNLRINYETDTRPGVLKYTHTVLVPNPVGYVINGDFVDDSLAKKLYSEHMVYLKLIKGKLYGTWTVILEKSDGSMQSSSSQNLNNYKPELYNSGYKPKPKFEGTSFTVLGGLSSATGFLGVEVHLKRLILGIGYSGNRADENGNLNAEFGIYYSKYRVMLNPYIKYSFDSYPVQEIDEFGNVMMIRSLNSCLIGVSFNPDIIIFSSKITPVINIGLGLGIVQRQYFGIEFINAPYLIDIYGSTWNFREQGMYLIPQFEISAGFSFR